ncbi:MAG: carboxylating nicotinate-nucleotide diphosphorylase [Bacteroidetes bacterium]|nr:carboxylating nicotinate-nucleotide diphosphorylase [Bacteroidota bacterium]
MNIDEIIKNALIEDIGDGDHTSLSCIEKNTYGKAKLLIKDKGILSGVAVAEKIFNQLDSNLMLTILLSDGAKINKGDIAFFVEGLSASILTAERLVLNFMQRMSGIATATAELVEIVKGTNAKILDTRKTTPLLREIEKMAVKTGGGYNHRMGLYDMIMIKDNHIDFAGGIEKAINATKAYLARNNKNLKIEIEARSIDDVKEIIKIGGINRIMLDNFSPENLKIAVQIINSKFETEASGGINKQNIRLYAETGVDFISVGAITHQIKSLDMSLKAI